MWPCVVQKLNPANLVASGINKQRYVYPFWKAKSNAVKLPSIWFVSARLAKFSTESKRYIVAQTLKS